MNGPVESDNSRAGSTLSRETILRALGDLNLELEARGVVGEICLFGGTVMVLAFRSRLATKDVDAVFEPAALVRELAARVAEASGLAKTWLNDGVKGYLSARHETTPEGLPQFASLRLTRPTPEYLLAMKCLASRIGSTRGEADDVADILFLIRYLKLPNPSAVLDIVTSYYPPDRVPVKTRFLVESLFEEHRL